MKKIILFLMLMSFFLNYSQSSEYMKYFKEGNKFDVQNLNSFVSEVYGANSNEILNERTLKSYQELFNFRMVYAEVPTEMLSGLTSTQDWEINNGFTAHREFNPETFNPFYYKIDFFSNYFSVFRIAETNYVLMIIPLK